MSKYAIPSAKILVFIIKNIPERTMKLKTIIFILIYLIFLPAMAGPARRGLIPLTQPDGTVFNAVFRGDEFLRIKTTAEGHAIIQDEEGWWCYAGFDGTGCRYSSGFRVGTDVPDEVLVKSKDIPYSVLSQNTALHRNTGDNPAQTMRRVMEKVQTRSGEKTVKHAIVILAQYSDVSFSNNRQSFVDLLTQKGYSANGAEGCAKDYFDAQFNGKVEFSFEVSTVVTLPGTRAYYGANNAGGNDTRAAEMIINACQIADNDIDFSIYDDDGDGFVDNIFVIFAGGDEANGDGEDCIWSHSWNIYYGAGYNISLDGKKLGRYACTAEFDKTLASSGYKDILTGIGTFCHEFSHSLGLMDMYDTDYEGSGGLSSGLWLSTSLMDNGNRNNNGNTPPYFNAIEREMLGISTPVIIDSDGSYRLEPVSDNGMAYRINTDNENEYYLIECRSGKDWDSHAGGSGMLIYHIDRSDRGSGYSTEFGKELNAAERWGHNEVNCNPAHQCADLLEADGRQDSFSGQNDLYNQSDNINGVFFPYSGITSITPEGQPGFRFWSGTSGKASITNIRKDGDDIMFSVIGFSEDSTPPVPKNIRHEVFADAAIISFESSRIFDGEAVIEYGRTGQGTVSKTIKAYEPGKFAAVIENLESGNRTYTATIAFSINGIIGESESVSFMTKKAPTVGWPFIYMGSTAKDKEGHIPAGTEIPLRTYNTGNAAEVSWTFNGTPVDAERTGYFTVSESGTLKAHIIWNDGSEEIILKEIITGRP